MRARHQEAFERELAGTALFAALAPEHLHDLARSTVRAQEPKGMVFSKAVSYTHLTLPTIYSV